MLVIIFFTPDSLKVDIGLSNLGGKTRERLYDPDNGGHKNSQLNWKYSNAAIIKGSLDWDLIPWISIGTSGWTTIASRGGYMDDTDWLDENQKTWTDQSRHPDTRLNYANEFDFNVKGWLLNQPVYRFGVMAGYQQSRYSSKANGGSYNYTDEDTGLADIGTFPDRTTVIGYKQHFKMPYIGLVADAINAVYSQARIQLCSVSHMAGIQLCCVSRMVRNSLRIVSWKDYKPVTRDLKALLSSSNGRIGATGFPDTFSGTWDETMQ